MMDKRWKIGIFRSPKSFSLQLFCHCDFFVIVSPPEAGVAISNLSVIARLLVREAVAIS